MYLQELLIIKRHRILVVKLFYVDISMDILAPAEKQVYMENPMNFQVTNIRKFRIYIISVMKHDIYRNSKH